jgi:uncharacterized membrane protein
MRGLGRSISDWVLEGVSAFALVAAGGDVAMHWSLLPARIPVHFGATGTPNAWGDRKMLLFLLAATIVMAVLLTIAESYQRLINIPIKVNRELPEVRRVLRSLAITMKAVIAVSSVWVIDLTMRTAVGAENGLGRAFVPLFPGALIVPIVYYLVKLARL